MKKFNDFEEFKNNLDMCYPKSDIFSGDLSEVENKMSNCLRSKRN